MEINKYSIKHWIFFLPVICLFFFSCNSQNDPNEKLEYQKIQAYGIDFNWGKGGPNSFAAPGLWASANPKKHIQWYKDLGANVIQTFAVSCNGYAWYKNGVVPEQPGLEYDFLTEMVRLGHQEGMKVMGYFCVSANTRWGQTHPEQSYGIPNDGHIPLTKEYLNYLGNAIQDALKKTNMDGFMIDWLFHGSRHPEKRIKWLPCEQTMWKELMGTEFPGKSNISIEQETEFARRSVVRCWEHIKSSAKSVNPDCIIWLSCYDLEHPQMQETNIFNEVDWLMNEAGDIATIEKLRDDIDLSVEIITCLAGWNKANPMEVVPAAQTVKVGLYGFSRPNENSLLPSPATYLDKNINEFEGNEKNIAALVRAYHGLPLDYIDK